MTLPTPSIEYFLLCPMLIVFGIAVVGVLAEAFLPRHFRYVAQVTLALGGLIGAFAADIVVSRSLPASGRSANHAQKSPNSSAVQYFGQMSEKSSVSAIVNMSGLYAFVVYTSM